jgi:hypothetical protein
MTVLPTEIRDTLVYMHNFGMRGTMPESARMPGERRSGLFQEEGKPGRGVSVRLESGARLTR